MSAELAILEYLSEPRKTLKYKGVRVGLFGLPDFKFYKYQTLANRCNILKRKEYIRQSSIGDYYITNKGRIFLERQKNILKKFDTDKEENSPKNLLIVYDIEEQRKREREWFRFHLKKFHFIMIQKSVWVGPSPLPEQFLNYLKEINLRENIKTFKLEKGYNKN